MSIDVQDKPTVAYRRIRDGWGHTWVAITRPSGNRLRKAHDVSGEARDKDGKWTKGGAVSSEDAPVATQTFRQKQVQSTGFKDWFGDWEQDPKRSSKIVDDKGAPLVVYHGTKSTFKKFSPSRATKYDSNGFYFSESPGTASFYAGDHDGDGDQIYPVYLNIRKPFVEGGAVSFRNATGQSRPYGKNGIKEERRLLEQAGYDGIIRGNTDGKFGEIIAFHPEQIKSATGNRGAFSSKSSDITKAVDEKRLGKDKWEVTFAGKKMVGHWRTAAGKRVFINEDGETIPASKIWSLDSAHEKVQDQERKNQKQKDAEAGIVHKRTPSKKHTYKTGQNPFQKNVVKSQGDLLRAAEQMSHWREWYDEYQEKLERIFGDDTPLFRKLLSATSQATGVSGNVTMALRAFTEYKTGKPFDGYLEGVSANLQRIRDDEAIQGMKIGQYAAANEGDEDGIAVDRHISQLLFNDKNPGVVRTKQAKAIIRTIAHRLGWQPREVQAALWAFNQVRKGENPQSYETYLEKRADEIAELRAAFAGGEGKGVSSGGEISESAQRMLHKYRAKKRGGKKVAQTDSPLIKASYRPMYWGRRSGASSRSGKPQNPMTILHMIIPGTHRHGSVTSRLLKAYDSSQPRRASGAGGGQWVSEGLTASKRREVLSLYDTVMRGRFDMQGSVSYAALPPSLVSSLRKEQGLDISGYQAFLSVPALRHIYKRHTHADSEAAVGNIPVTPHDIVHIANVMASPDRIWRERPIPGSGRVEDALVFQKRIRGNYHVVFLIDHENKRLSLKTMRILKGIENNLNKRHSTLYGIINLGSIAPIRKAIDEKKVGDDLWEVKTPGGKTIQGHWRTKGGHRVFLSADGATTYSSEELGGASKDTTSSNAGTDNDKGRISDGNQSSKADAKAEADNQVWQTLAKFRREIYAERQVPATSGSGDDSKQSTVEGFARVTGQPRSSTEGRRLLTIGGKDVSAVASFEITPQFRQTIESFGGDPLTFHEITDHSAFHSLVQNAYDTLKFGKCVTVHEPDDYKPMRMFVSDGGSSGFALRGDEIVSAFSTSGNRAGHQILQMATDNGGRRLDCFDTVLPKIYSDMGFTAVSRIPFNDDYKPDGWDYEAYKNFNKGKPDVVFMVFDPLHSRPYQAGDGKRFDDYDKAQETQVSAVKPIQKGRS